MSDYKPLSLPFGVYVSTDDDLDAKYRVVNDTARDALITSKLVKAGHVIYHEADGVRYMLKSYPTEGDLTGVVWDEIYTTSDGNLVSDAEKSAYLVPTKRVFTETDPSTIGVPDAGDSWIGTWGGKLWVKLPDGTVDYNNINGFRGFVDTGDVVPANLQNGDWVRAKTTGTYTNFSGVSANAGDRIQYSVDSSTWGVVNDSGSGDIALTSDMDAANHKIINLADGVNDGDAVNAKQFNATRLTFKPAKNIFNKNEVVWGYYIDSTNFDYGVNADSAISGHCIVEEGKQYYITNPARPNTEYIVYDENDNDVLHGEFSNTTPTGVIPAGAKYMIFNAVVTDNTATFDTTQVEADGVTEYEPFHLRAYHNGTLITNYFDEILGKVTENELDSSVKSKFKTGNDELILQYNAQKPSAVHNAVTGIYGTTADISIQRRRIDKYDPNADNLTLQREYLDYLLGKYKDGAAVSLKSEYSAQNTDGSAPVLSFKIYPEDLKAIGIDLNNYDDNNPQKISFRALALTEPALQGIDGTQVYFVLTYDLDIQNQNGYYLGDNGIKYVNGIDVLGAIVDDADNSEKNFAHTTKDKQLINENGYAERNYIYNGVNLYKNVMLNGNQLTFTGIIINILPGDNLDTTQLERKIYGSRVAVVNAADYPDFNFDTDIRNYPDDVIFWQNKQEETISKETVTIENSDKIAFFGCSYTESAYAIKNKSWVNKLSQLTDWIVANYGQSGNRITKEVERLRSNDHRYHPTLGVKDYKPTIVSFANIGNETLINLDNLDMYRQELLLAYQAVRSLGAEMIIGTDHFAERSLEAMLYGLGKELNITIAPFGSIGKKVLNPSYHGFWGGIHPATRTNAFTFLEWYYYISQLRRPQKSIKVFRVRSEYKSGTPTIDDLNYDTILQRLRYFQELNVGERSLDENGGWEYYDRLDEGFTIAMQTNEYLKLLNNESVSFNDYALIEIIIPKIKPNKVIIEIEANVTPDSIYIANNDSPDTRFLPDDHQAAFRVDKTTYDNFNEAVGEAFTSDATGTATLTYAGKVKGGYLGGYWLWFDSSDSAAAAAAAGNLTKTADSSTTAYLEHSYDLARHKINLFEKYEQAWSKFENIAFTQEGAKLIIETTETAHIQYDKVRLIIAKSGSFNISDIRATVEGGIEKVTIKPEAIKPKENYTELNTYQGFGTDWLTTGGWVNNGAIHTQMPSGVADDYPPIHNVGYHIELGYDSTDGFPTSIKKTFTLPNNKRGVSKVIIRVLARLFPKIYNTTVTADNYHTQVRQITPDSYDMGTLVCKLANQDTHFAILKKPVDIGWAEITFETYLPSAEAGDFTIELYRDEQDKIDGNYRNTDYPLQVYDVSVQIEG